MDVNTFGWWVALNAAKDELALAELDACETGDQRMQVLNVRPGASSYRMGPLSNLATNFEKSCGTGNGAQPARAGQAVPGAMCSMGSFGRKGWGIDLAS